MHERVAVIGAGIVGVAHAWREAKHGAKVTLFERDNRAKGASIRNFGMVWPIGQPISKYDTALLSRSLWQEFIKETKIWHEESGSLHVAKQQDEWHVLEEFYELSKDLGYNCKLLDLKQTLERSEGVTRESLRGSLWSDTEIGVDPREVIATAPQWLADQYGVVLEHGTTISEIDFPTIRSTEGREWSFDRVTVASGADFATLYPDLFAKNRLAKCKLQMMRSVAQPAGWRLGPMIASGLTLRHYPTFEICSSLSELSERIKSETPLLDQYGIHVMAAQNGQGEVVLGDSHEYEDSILPFDKEEITDLILKELKKIIELPDWTLNARWHGIYAIQQENSLQFVSQPEDGVTIVIATGGCGMTMSFGLAERMAIARRVSAEEKFLVSESNLLSPLAGQEG